MDAEIIDYWGGDDQYTRLIKALERRRIPTDIAISAVEHCTRKLINGKPVAPIERFRYVANVASERRLFEYDPEARIRKRVEADLAEQAEALQGREHELELALRCERIQTWTALTIMWAALLGHLL